MLKHNRLRLFPARQECLASCCGSFIFTGAAKEEKIIPAFSLGNAVLLGFLLLGGCHRSEAPSAAPPGDGAGLQTQEKTGTRPASGFSWKIATYNIYWNSTDMAELAKTIRRADADVVCLQETSPRAESYLRRDFSDIYPHIHFQGYQGKHLAERLGILSRFPIGRLTFFPPKYGMFGFLSAELQIGQVPVQIINVHLQPFLPRPDANLLEMLSTLASMEGVHRRETEYVLEHRSPDRALVIAGDLNSLSSLGVPQLLEQKGLTDSFARVHENADLHPTWHRPSKNGELKFRIDYIFHSREFQTVTSRIVKSDASDHYLLLSELKKSPEK